MSFQNWLENDFKVTRLCVIVSAVALVLSLGRWLVGIIPVDIAWVAIVLCGIPIVVGAIKALITEHDIKADVLVSMALIASVATKEFFAAGEVALIMQLGSLLEDFTANRARKGIENLIRLTPKTARIMRDGTLIEIPVEEVAAGDELTIIAGETIPVDGVILSGETSVDQSAMTGESIPVDKRPGDELKSGTVNRYGTVQMRAVRSCEDSSLQRMITLAEAADANQAPIVGLADRWASWMVGIALACAIVTGLVTGEFLRAVTVLVVFCPCAFILATPTAVAAAIGNLTRYGILVRTGDALERLAQVEVAAFDKTGTLTKGHPNVTAVRSLNLDFSEKDVLRLAAGAERYSEHPLGKAIVNAFEESGGIMPEVSSAQALAGFGVSAVLEGHQVSAGKAELFSGQDGMKGEWGSWQEPYLAQGATVTFLVVDGKTAGLIALADTLRPEAADTVQKLKSQGISSLLLTGDNERAAGAIADRVGLEQVQANLLPEEKMDYIRQRQDEKICMVGDGVNDALALHSAFAGVAMGGIGSDIAVESADAVLVEDDLTRLPYLFLMTKRTMKRVKQNIIISLAINLTAIILSAFGVLVPVTAAIVHNCGSVFVVVNAARLLACKDEKI